MASAILDLHFHAHVIGQHELLAGALREFAHGERRRKRGDAGMREQAVDAILGGGELGIVEIVGVDGDAVGKGGEARGRLYGSSR